MAGAILGGVGLGLVWGSLLVMLGWPARREPVRTVVGLGLASLLLVVAVEAIAGLPGATALAAATAVALAAGLAWRVERRQRVGTRD